MIGLAFALLFTGQPAPAYDELVERGVRLGKEGQMEAAALAFDRAIAVAPRRPEAWVERGGLRFLEARYPEAVRDLERGLALREDEYTRDLLASSLYLAGRTDDALATWNAMGRPTLRSLQISGLVHTRDAVARRELSLAEGELLDVGGLRASRLRLQECGVFERVTLRPTPRTEGRADLEVALAERHGFAASWTDFAVSTGVNLAFGQARLKYANIAGAGLSVGGLYRWAENRPLAALSLEWPRPFGLPAYLRLQGSRGRQAYAIGGDFTSRSGGVDLGLRHVLGARTVGQIAFRFRDRSFTIPRPDAPPGVIFGVDLALQHRLSETHRQRLDGSLRLFRTAEGLGSELAYTRAVASVEYQVLLSAREEARVQRSLLAARVLWGRGSSGMPVDEMFTPGASPDMELPLRAHRQAPEGILGAAPIGRSVGLVNLEWRRRLLSRPGVQLVWVFLYDGARIADNVQGPARVLHDVGVGLRLALPGAPALRIDYGHGLSDGKNALFIGLNEVF